MLGIHNNASPPSPLNPFLLPSTSTPFYLYTHHHLHSFYIYTQTNNMTQSNNENDERTALLEQQHNPSHYNSTTLTWSELPKWMQDNIFITSGYRSPNNSYRRCFQSLFYLHNESGLCSFSLLSLTFLNTLGFFDNDHVLNCVVALYSQYLESPPWSGAFHCSFSPLFLVSTFICRFLDHL